MCPLLQVCEHLDGSNAENKISLLVILYNYVCKKKKKKSKPIFVFTKPIMVKCLNIGRNIGQPIYRSISTWLALWLSLLSTCNWCVVRAYTWLALLALFHCMVRHGTVRYGSLLGVFPLGTVPGTWYFFSTTSVEVPSSRTVTKTWRVNSADHWMAGENRHYCVTELATRDPSSTALPARFNQHSQRRIGRNFCLNKRTFFASTTK